MKIIQKGNKYTNYSSRDGHVPCCIVNHISAGSMSSMDNWFTSSGNTVSSAHYGVSKDGRIHHYVDIKLMAWANGITSTATTQAPAKIVRDHPGVNPNKYTVSIEHEGTDGNLTEEQFAASVWLHRHIQAEIKRIWSKELQLDDYHVIGHYQIDPIRKANCPGPKFPWSRLYKELKGENEVSKIPVKIIADGKSIQNGLIIENVTYAPVRVLAEVLGAQVTWDQKSSTVLLESRQFGK
ncbi:N-acetylmuramoyl-L-alanine amidase [Paenibacillus sp. ACRRX]|uniref:N-acetylmuramoyl-L-alanine amidase n=1 Tax=Paenibacillus sp. ACRRX TaxID=2918206 RepID=UPI001EF5FD6F|nr:N-acetylmuramoyl-L-alanine amidase [Paenibacillus sp. ACRRX]MCG7406793.1 N-acetylmuramoyl-L-alanine amidase [Paenibacillus sp. ACRRX]